jgi:hypothetical protein
MLVAIIIGLATAGTLLVTAVVNLVVSIGNRQRVNVVHSLVNSRMTEAMERIDRLELQLERHGNVPVA